MFYWLISVWFLVFWVFWHNWHKVDFVLEVYRLNQGNHEFSLPSRIYKERIYIILVFKRFNYPYVKYLGRHIGKKRKKRKKDCCWWKAGSVRRIGYLNLRVYASTNRCEGKTILSNINIHWTVTVFIKMFILKAYINTLYSFYRTKVNRMFSRQKVIQTIKSNKI